MIVGTQVDLRDDQAVQDKLARQKQRPVGIEMGERLAKELGAVKYVECSALTQKGLKNVFDEVSDKKCSTADCMKRRSADMYFATRLFAWIGYCRCTGTARRSEEEEVYHPLSTPRTTRGIEVWRWEPELRVEHNLVIGR